MSGPLRSKQGCWTCRLRKKKCDEKHPQCSTCESLSITCYGYGPKPAWMENSDRVGAVSNDLKKTVKHTSRRKDTKQVAKQSHSTIRIAPKPSSVTDENVTAGLSSASQRSITPPVVPQISQPPSNESKLDVLQESSNNPTANDNSHELITGPVFLLSAEESISLMHFLDNIFPLQYPIYKPKLQVGGRGWLLALLLDTKPLYHAALALSVYHRRITHLESLNADSYVDSVIVQQSKHLEICMKSVEHMVQDSTRNTCIDTISSVVQLLFFELFAGYGNTWQAHLHAAANIFQYAIMEDFHHCGLDEDSRRILYSNLPLSEYDPLIIQQVVTFRFMSGTITWLDIISSITSGTAPQLLPYHSSILATGSETKLEDIMGCKNSVMLQIGRIAALHECRIQALGRHFDCKEFAQTVGDIGEEIKYILSHSAFGDLDVSNRDLSSAFLAMPDPPTLATYMFAHMATIYLHLVVYGFQKLEQLDTSASEALRILQTQTPRHLLPALVAPLYFLGSIASQSNEQFFRDILSSPPILDPLLRHRENILSKLEEIWSKRRIAPDLSWKDAIALSSDVLLV